VRAAAHTPKVRGDTTKYVNFHPGHEPRASHTHHCTPKGCRALGSFIWGQTSVTSKQCHAHSSQREVRSSTEHGQPHRTWHLVQASCFRNELDHLHLHDWQGDIPAPGLEFCFRAWHSLRCGACLCMPLSGTGPFLAQGDASDICHGRTASETDAPTVPFKTMCKSCQKAADFSRALSLTSILRQHIL
jgi:hypothetical protein